MDKTQQETLEKPEEEYFRCTHAKTEQGFLEKLNQHAKEGYKPIWDTLDFITRDGVNAKFIYLYNSDIGSLNSDEKSKRMQIIDAIDEAESYLYDRKTSLEGRENYLLLETNWDKVNAQRKIDDLSKISNEKQRTAHLNNDKDLKLLKQEVQEAEQWLKVIKKYAELHELPNGVSPWEQKQREREEEISKMVKAEKVQDKAKETV